MCRYSGTSRPAAAARQAACDTASMAFAPRRAFVGVPSSSIKRPSRTAWSSAARPRTAGPMMSIDIGDGPTDAKTAVSRRVAVAELDSLMRSRRCPGWDRAPADDPVRQFDIRLDGRPAARVEDLAPDHALDPQVRTCRSFRHSTRTVRTRSTSACWSLGGSMSASPPSARAIARSDSPVRYSTGDFPSTRASRSAPVTRTANGPRPNRSSPTSSA